MSIPPTDPESEVIIVTKVKWWAHLVPVPVSVVLAVLALLQVAGIAWVATATDNTADAIIKLEMQINSNMARQMEDAVKRALAERKFVVLEEQVAEDKAEEAKEDQAEEMPSP